MIVKRAKGRTARFAGVQALVNILQDDGLINPMLQPIAEKATGEQHSTGRMLIENHQTFKSIANGARMQQPCRSPLRERTARLCPMD
jgi:hypothetical protein